MLLVELFFSFFAFWVFIFLFFIFSDFQHVLERWCLEGTRVQSKYAVSAIAALSGTSTQITLTEVCKVSFPHCLLRWLAIVWFDLHVCYTLSHDAVCLFSIVIYRYRTRQLRCTFPGLSMFAVMHPWFSLWFSDFDDWFPWECLSLHWSRCLMWIDVWYYTFFQCEQEIFTVSEIIWIGINPYLSYFQFQSLASFGRIGSVILSSKCVGKYFGILFS